LVEKEGGESLVAALRGMIRIFDVFKKTYKNSVYLKRIWIKKNEMTQKQLNELKKDLNKLLNETKDIILKK
jgi:hypothetical protein